jgi:hypothetical protein
VYAHCAAARDTLRYREVRMAAIDRNEGQPDHGIAWIDALTDAECMEVFWLYVDQPEAFLAAHPPQLLGAAMRLALHDVARTYGIEPRPADAARVR